MKLLRLLSGVIRCDDISCIDLVDLRVKVTDWSTRGNFARHFFCNEISRTPTMFP